MSDAMLWTAVIVVLILIIVLMTRVYSKFSNAVSSSLASQPIPIGDGMYMVIYQGHPMSVSSEWFTAKIGEFKSDVVAIFDAMGTVSCKTTILPLLQNVKQQLEYAVRNQDADKPFCDAVDQYMTKNGAGYDAWQKTMTGLRNSKASLLRMTRSDSEMSDQLGAAFDDILLRLDAIVHTVASKVCTHGRINLDYVKAAIDKVGALCDGGARRSSLDSHVASGFNGLVQPWLDTPSNPDYMLPGDDPTLPNPLDDPNSTLHRIKQQDVPSNLIASSQDESFENIPRANVPGGGLRAKHIGNDVNEAEYAVRIPMGKPRGPPPMMKQIALDSDDNPIDGNVDDLPVPGNRARAGRQTAPRSIIGKTNR